MPKKIIAYCSWCYEKSSHKLYDEAWIGRDSYHCGLCRAETVPCAAYDCSNMAQSGQDSDADQSWCSQLLDAMPDLYCAEHNGTIPSFKSLTMRLRDISHFKKLLEAKETDWSAYTQIASVALGSVLVSGSMTYFLAPQFAALLGAAGKLGNAFTGRLISSLSGEALESASLAMIGSSGVASMVAIGAGLGGVNGGLIAHSYLKELESFSIRKIKSGKGPSVIFINGFLCEDDHDFTDWTRGASHEFGKNPWYQMTWDSGTQSELIDAVSSVGATLKQIAASASDLISWDSVFLPNKVATNPWVCAIFNASKAAAVLAELIIRSPQEYILMGHSLGARVIHQTLEILSTKSLQKIVEVHLMGAATDASDRKSWLTASRAVQHKIYNYYSRHDSVLSTLFATSTGFTETPAGIAPIKGPRPKVRNVDVSSLVSGHLEFKPALADLLAKGRRKPPAQCKAAGGKRARIARGE